MNNDELNRYAAEEIMQWKYAEVCTMEGPWYDGVDGKLLMQGGWNPCGKENIAQAFMVAEKICDYQYDMFEIRKMIDGWESLLNIYLDHNLGAKCIQTRCTDKFKELAIIRACVAADQKAKGK